MNRVLYGPYTYSDGFPRYLIVDHDENGSVISRKTVSYSQYHSNLNLYQDVILAKDYNRHNTRYTRSVTQGPVKVYQHIDVSNQEPIGIVNGPYFTKELKPFIEVLIITIDGTVSEIKNIPFRKYNKECREGLHQYKRKFDIPERLVKSVKPFKSFCYNCKTEYERHRTFSYCCCRNCYDQYYRRKTDAFAFDEQLVTKIKSDKDNEYFFIVTELNDIKRDHKLINSIYTEIELTEDRNGILHYKLIYDSSRVINIRLVPGYKKYFYITDTGILISRRTNAILSQHLSKTGYYVHATRFDGRDGINDTFRIHRFVALAFVPNPDSKPFVNHKDGVKTNNHWTNLEWVTNQENIDHAVRTGLMEKNRPIGEKVGSARITNEIARQIRELREKGLSANNIKKFYDIKGIYITKWIIGNVLRGDNFKDV